MPGRILIAHSIAANRVSLKSALKSEYFDVMCVAHVKDLQAAILKDKPDLILLPKELENEDGYNLCKRMKLNAFHAHIPVVVIANDNSEVDWGLALTSLVDDVFVFPKQKKNMISRLRQLYRHKAEIDALKTHANIYSDTGFHDIAIETPADRLHEAKIVICEGSSEPQISLNPKIGSVTRQDANQLDIQKLIKSDLVVLDQCPEQQALLAEIKGHGELRHLPTLCVVNSAKQKDLKKLLELGATDFIEYPFSENQISTRVKSLLGLSLFKKSINNTIQDRIKEADIDPLTGLYNRRHAHHFLEKTFRTAQRNKKNLIALMMDIDNFKSINDRLGHICGDEVLAEFGSMLKDNLREVDLIARVGGEEFLILISGVSVKKGEAIAQRLRKSIMNEPFDLMDGKLSKRVTVSIGVACNASWNESGMDLIKSADDALYQAKHKGRNCVRVFKAA